MCVCFFFVDPGFFLCIWWLYNFVANIRYTYKDILFKLSLLSLNSTFFIWWYGFLLSYNFNVCLFSPPLPFSFHFYLYIYIHNFFLFLFVSVLHLFRFTRSPAYPFSHYRKYTIGICDVCCDKAWKAYAIFLPCWISLIEITW